MERDLDLALAPTCAARRCRVPDRHRAGAVLALAGSRPRSRGTRAGDPRCGPRAGSRPGPAGSRSGSPTRPARRRARAAGPSAAGSRGAPGPRTAAGSSAPAPPAAGRLGGARSSWRDAAERSFRPLGMLDVRAAVRQDDMAAWMHALDDAVGRSCWKDRVREARRSTPSHARSAGLRQPGAAAMTASAARPSRLIFGQLLRATANHFQHGARTRGRRRARGPAGARARAADWRATTSSWPRTARRRSTRWPRSRPTP